MGAKINEIKQVPKKNKNKKLKTTVNTSRGNNGSGNTNILTTQK